MACCTSRNRSTGRDQHYCMCKRLRLHHCGLQQAPQGHALHYQRPRAAHNQLLNGMTSGSVRGHHDRQTCTAATQQQRATRVSRDRDEAAATWRPLPSRHKMQPGRRPLRNRGQRPVRSGPGSAAVVRRGMHGQGELGGSAAWHGKQGGDGAQHGAARTSWARSYGSRPPAVSGRRSAAPP